MRDKSHLKFSGHTAKFVNNFANILKHHNWFIFCHLANLSQDQTLDLAEAEVSFNLQTFTQPPNHQTGKVSDMQYRA